MANDEPPYLNVGTDVSAKYKGAFCEAKIKKVNRVVKCKVTFKNNLGSFMVTDDLIKGPLRIGADVEAKHPEKSQFLEAVINKLQDYSQYTVVFDDGDETTLRRTSLCLKSGRHFAESPTLDQFPLTNPEHFGTPVIGAGKYKRKRRSTMNSSLDYESSDDDSFPRKLKAIRGKERDPDLGKVVAVDYGDRRKKDSWYPGLIVPHPAQSNIKISKEEHLIRSFKDGKYYQVPKRDTREFLKDNLPKIENNALKTAVDKAILYLEKEELPAHWDKALFMGLELPSADEDSQDSDLDTSDDEPSEDKDRFVAQLYKFMDERGTPINKAPTVSNKDLNLHKLFKIMHKLGGFNKVTNQNKWKTVYIKMGLPQSNANGPNQIKCAYKRYLQSFEDFYRKLGCTMVNNSRSTRGRHRSDRNFILTRTRDRETTSSPKGRNSKDTKDKGTPDKKPEDKPRIIEKKEVKSEDTAKPEDKPKSPEKKRPEKPRSEEKDDKQKKEERPRLVRSQSLNKEKKVSSPKEEEKKDTKPDKARTREDARKEKTESPEKKGTRSSVKIEMERKEKEESSKEKKDQSPNKKDKKEEKCVKDVKEEKPKEKKDDKNLKDRKIVKDKKPDEKPVKDKIESSPKEKKEDRLVKEKRDSSKEPKEDKGVKGRKEETKTEEKSPLKKKLERIAKEKKEEKVVVRPRRENKSPLPDKKNNEEADSRSIKDEKSKSDVESKKEEIKDKPGPKLRDRREDTPYSEEGYDNEADISDDKDAISLDGFEKKGPGSKLNDEPPNKGRKRSLKMLEKDLDDTMSDSDDDEQDKDSKDLKNCEIELGDRVKVKYGRGRLKKVYDAKVLKIQTDGSEKRYFVHYNGWNNRYDEWVKRSFIVALANTNNKQGNKEISQKPPHQSPKRIDRGRPPGPILTSKPTRKNSTSSTNSSLSSSRATRSDKKNLTSSPLSSGLETKKRSRRKSGLVGLTDTSQDSDSDVEENVDLDDGDADVEDNANTQNDSCFKEELFSDDEEKEKLEDVKRVDITELEKNICVEENAEDVKSAFFSAKREPVKMEPSLKEEKPEMKELQVKLKEEHLFETAKEIEKAEVKSEKDTGASMSTQDNTLKINEKESKSQQIESLCKLQSDCLPNAKAENLLKLQSESTIKAQPETPSKSEIAKPQSENNFKTQLDNICKVETEKLTKTQVLDKVPKVQMPEKICKIQLPEKLPTAQLSEKAPAVQLPIKVPAVQLPEKTSKIQLVPEKLSKMQAADKISKLQLPEKSPKFQMTDRLARVQLPDKLSKTQLPDKFSKAQLPDKLFKAQLSDKLAKSQFSEKLSKPLFSDKLSKSQFSDRFAKIQLPEKTPKIQLTDRLSKIQLPEKVFKVQQPEKAAKLQQPENQPKTLQSDKLLDADKLHASETPVISNVHKNVIKPSETISNITTPTEVKSEKSPFLPLTSKISPLLNKEQKNVPKTSFASSSLSAPESRNLSFAGLIQVNASERNLFLGKNIKESHIKPETSKVSLASPKIDLKLEAEPKCLTSSLFKPEKSLSLFGTSSILSPSKLSGIIKPDEKPIIKNSIFGFSIKSNEDKEQSRQLKLESPFKLALKDTSKEKSEQKKEDEKTVKPPEVSDKKSESSPFKSFLNPPTICAPKLNCSDIKPEKAKGNFDLLAESSTPKKPVESKDSLFPLTFSDVSTPKEKIAPEQHYNKALALSVENLCCIKPKPSDTFDLSKTIPSILERLKKDVTVDVKGTESPPPQKQELSFNFLRGSQDTAKSLSRSESSNSLRICEDTSDTNESNADSKDLVINKKFETSSVVSSTASDNAVPCPAENLVSQTAVTKTETSVVETPQSTGSALESKDVAKCSLKTSVITVASIKSPPLLSATVPDVKSELTDVFASKKDSAPKEDEKKDDIPVTKQEPVSKIEPVVETKIAESKSESPEPVGDKEVKSETVKELNEGETNNAVKPEKASSSKSEKDSLFDDLLKIKNSNSSFSQSSVIMWNTENKGNAGTDEKPPVSSEEKKTQIKEESVSTSEEDQPSVSKDEVSSTSPPTETSTPEKAEGDEVDSASIVNEVKSDPEDNENPDDDVGTSSLSKKESKKKRLGKKLKKIGSSEGFEKEDKESKLKDGKSKSKKRKLENDDSEKNKDPDLKSKSKKIKKNKNKKRLAALGEHKKTDGDDDHKEMSDKTKKKEKRKSDKKLFKSGMKGEFSDSKLELKKKKGKKNRDKLGGDKKDFLDKKTKKKKKPHIEDNQDTDSDKDVPHKSGDKKKKKDRKKFKAKDSSSSDDAGDKYFKEQNKGISNMSTNSNALLRQDSKSDDPDMSFLLCEEKVPASPVGINNMADDTSGSSSMEGGRINPAMDILPLPPVYPCIDNMESSDTLNKHSIDTSAVLDNTPPTTPSSTESLLSSSPSHERDPFSMNYPESTQSGRDSAEGESDIFRCNSNRTIVRGSDEYHAATTLAFAVCKSVPDKSTKEEPSHNFLKRQKSEVDEHQPTKRKKKSKRVRRCSESAKSPRHRSSLSRLPKIESCLEDSSCASLAASSSPPYTSVRSPHRLSCSSEGFPKYNFFVPLHEKDPEKRIALLQEKMAALRKAYMDLRSKCIALDHKRRRARKKVREAGAANVNPTAQSEDGQNCS